MRKALAFCCGSVGGLLFPGGLLMCNAYVPLLGSLRNGGTGILLGVPLFGLMLAAFLVPMLKRPMYAALAGVAFGAVFLSLPATLVFFWGCGSHHHGGP